MSHPSGFFIGGMNIHQAMLQGASLYAHEMAARAAVVQQQQQHHHHHQMPPFLMATASQGSIHNHHHPGNSSAVHRRPARDPPGDRGEDILEDVDLPPSPESLSGPPPPTPHRRAIPVASKTQSGGNHDDDDDEVAIVAVVAPAAPATPPISRLAAAREASAVPHVAPASTSSAVRVLGGSQREKVSSVPPALLATTSSRNSKMRLAGVAGSVSAAAGPAFAKTTVPFATVPVVSSTMMQYAGTKRSSAVLGHSHSYMQQQGAPAPKMARRNPPSISSNHGAASEARPIVAKSAPSVRSVFDKLEEKQATLQSRNIFETLERKEQKQTQTQPKAPPPSFTPRPTPTQPLPYQQRPPQNHRQQQGPTSSGARPLSFIGVKRRLPTQGKQRREGATVGRKTLTSAAPARNTFSSAARKASLLGGTPPVAVGEQTSYWYSMYQKLQEFHKTHGHCRVTLANSKDDPTLDPMLGVWIMMQKEMYVQGKLTADQKAKLRALDFDFGDLPEKHLKKLFKGGSTFTEKPKGESRAKIAASNASFAKISKRTRTFEENYKALVAYKQKYGNVDVPQKYDADKKLGIWVKNVRQHPYRHTEEQRQRLDKLGFKWRKLQLNSQWNEAFEQLLEYKREQGDCNVPSRWTANPALARWVHTQRTMYRKDKLMEERKQMLEAVGFVWDCNAIKDDESFNGNLEKALEFRSEHSHVNIPPKYRKDRSLGRWASQMRELHANNLLDAERMEALNEIGFIWRETAPYDDNDDSGIAGTSSSQSDAESLDSDEESDASTLLV